jgi:Trk-type K+ transport system membrane component
MAYFKLLQLGMVNNETLIHSSSLINLFGRFSFIAGYSVVDVSSLNPGTLIVFIVAMYISSYPVAISMRNSNIYQVCMIQSCYTNGINPSFGYIGASLGHL